MSDSSPSVRNRLRILVVDDEENIRFAVAVSLESDGHQVATAGTVDAALEATAREAFDLIYLDVRLGNDNGLDHIPALLADNPWARIIVITAYASIATAIQAMKLGASDYLPKPFEHAHLLMLTRKVAERRALERNMEALQLTLGAMDPEWDFPTVNLGWQESLEVARRVAASNATILIQGEPGTGRGRLARGIHAWSLRSQGPFTSVPLQGSGADAAETELFGGPTGQSTQISAVARAHGGTLLLEDIGYLPLRLQPTLVALLRDKEFENADASVRRPIDVRVVATSGVELGDLVAAGEFRADLYAALNIIRIHVPALRERASDVPLLASRYLAHFAREHHRQIVGFTPDAMFLLESHHWPGNVRELRNVIERTVLICDSDQIDLKHLPVELVNGRTDPSAPPTPSYAIGDLVSIEVIEAAHIRAVLAAVRTRRRAASILKIDQSTIFRKLRDYQASKEAPDDKPA